MSKRVAVVTGAAGTIGMGIVDRLLADGRRVAMVDIAAAKLQEAAGRFPQDSVLTLPIDICAADAPGRIDAAVRARWEPTSILINNAGISVFASVTEVSDDEWARTLAVNLTAPMRLAAQFLPHMQAQRWGRIVNISSRAGRSNPNKAGVAYVASKAAALGLTRSIATSAGAHGVTCNAVAPGFVDSELSRGLPPEAIEALIERTPLARAGTARELGAAVAFLASEDAGFITGTCLDVNGGQSML